MRIMTIAFLIARLRNITDSYPRVPVFDRYPIDGLEISSQKVYYFIWKDYEYFSDYENVEYNDLARKVRDEFIKTKDNARWPLRLKKDKPSILN